MKLLGAGIVTQLFELCQLMCFCTALLKLCVSFESSGAVVFGLADTSLAGLSLKGASTSWSLCDTAGWRPLCVSADTDVFISI